MSWHKDTINCTSETGEPDDADVRLSYVGARGKVNK